jgi:hypothetical protein
MSERDPYTRGYEAARSFYTRQNAALQSDVNRLTTALEKAEALSWEMCPEDGRRLREALNA